MKRTVIFLAAIFITLTVACQSKDKIFTMPVRLQGGVYLGTETTLHTTWPTGTGTVTWDAITGKPTLFPPSAHNHDLLYRPLSWLPSWNDVIGKPLFHAVATSGSYNDLKDKPVTTELSEALPTLSGIRLPVLTQTQINALTPVKGLLLWNDTEGVLQVYSGTAWKTIMTNL